MTREIRCLPDAAALHASAAEVFERASVEAVRAIGMFSVALAGGSTPKGLYSFLADDPRLRSSIPWSNIHFFWGDERHVPPDHPQSNYRMAHEAMLSRVPARPGWIHRVQAEHPHAAITAGLYEGEVRAAIGPEIGVPRFDLILLGLGADGHTASLFPGTQALSERARLVVANWVETLGAYRITMTLPLINAARQIMFIVAGKDKASVVRAVLEPRDQRQTFPAQLVRPQNGRVLWLLDRDAASQLDDIPQTAPGGDRGQQEILK